MNDSKYLRQIAVSPMLNTITVTRQSSPAMPTRTREYRYTGARNLRIYLALAHSSGIAHAHYRSGLHCYTILNPEA
jgi:hypothetical protein